MLASNKTRHEAGSSLHKDPTEDLPVLPQVAGSGRHVPFLCSGKAYITLYLNSGKDKVKCSMSDEGQGHIKFQSY